MVIVSKNEQFYLDYKWLIDFLNRYHIFNIVVEPPIYNYSNIARVPHDQIAVFNNDAVAHCLY